MLDTAFEKPLVLIVVCIAFSVLSSFLFFRFYGERVIAKDIPVYEGTEENFETKSDENIFVEISGAILSPGVYELLHGSRVINLIQKGGGLSNDADVAWIAKHINFSKKLEDSQKVYLPFIWDNFVGTDTDVGELIFNDTVDESASTFDKNDETSSSLISLINVNTSTKEQLDTLAGIGPTYAQKIIDNRPYFNFEELKSKSGVPSKTLDGIKDALTY